MLNPKLDVGADVWAASIFQKTCADMEIPMVVRYGRDGYEYRHASLGRPLSAAEIAFVDAVYEASLDPAKRRYAEWVQRCEERERMLRNADHLKTPV